MKTMNVPKEEKRLEALARLNLLTKRFNLDPRIRECFAEGALFYSYKICDGVAAAIDSIGYDLRYLEEAVYLEDRTDCLVYHAIESGDNLALLFVSDYRSDWEHERLQGTSLWAYVRNYKDPNLSGVKYISLDSSLGALLMA